MWANNETGVIFPVEEIARAARAQGAYFHTDAVQAVGKVPVRTWKTPRSISSRSPGTSSTRPKASARSYIDRRSRFTPFLVGGGQEGGRRGGTENVAGIVASRQSRRTGRRAPGRRNKPPSGRCATTSSPGFSRACRARRSTAAARRNACPTRRASISRRRERGDAGAVGQGRPVRERGQRVHGGVAASLARADGDGFFHRTRPLQPAVFLQPLQHVRTQIARGLDIVVAAVEKLRRMVPATVN